MLIKESIWLKEQVEKTPAKDLSLVLYIGSSNLNLRTKRQPWIETNIYKTLYKKNVKVINLDILKGKGVDIVCDVESKDFLRKINKYKLKFRSVFIFDLLEHLSKKEKFCKKVIKLLPPGGLIFVSCPYKYPYHPDPIDTMYRPKPLDIMSLFPNTKVVAKKIVNDYPFSYYLNRDKKLYVYYFFRFLLPFLSFKRWKSAYKHIFWMKQTFSASCLVLKKVR